MREVATTALMERPRRDMKPWVQRPWCRAPNRAQAARTEERVKRLGGGARGSASMALKRERAARGWPRLAWPWMSEDQERTFR
ncbi:hypothetical protein IEQ34_010034 [Dendrobium chrysotoxum]|uniref:Uncharacterized protein n=1 Tax=Dendrobium chrysotoxum TaxID=161865 RepID=A0AAV7H324_DENCH|nr:hypothetical protein IEQ34_010034 [Dendrobium chrysotoxum]